MTFNAKNFLSLFFITAILSISACKKEEQSIPLITGSSGISYPESKNMWENLKVTEGDSYAYQTRISSWTGFSRMTEIEVENGVVVARIYIAKNSNGQITESYTENENELNTHTLGAATVTIDELYDTCLADYLSVDLTQNTIYFNTAEFGLLVTCGFAPKGCQDDCFEGIQITGFEWR